MTDTPIIEEFDELQLYFGEDYVVTDTITIHQPTLGEIIEMGEQRYFQMIFNLTCIPSDMKSLLWDIGIDWETISDFDLFTMMAPALKVDDTKILFGDKIDFSAMSRFLNTVSNLPVLAYPDGSVMIDEYVYAKMVGYLRKLHGLKPKVEHAANKSTKEVLIMLDRQDHAKVNEKPFQSTLLPYISSLLNSPGFKYKKSELKEVHYYEFMDSVRRINVLKNADLLAQGVYAGNVDPKKLDKKALNGFRDLSNEA